MSAAQALAGIGTADLGEEANEFRAQMRRWIPASVPPGLAGMTQWNMPGIPRDQHALAMASPEYREREQQLLDAQPICPSLPAAHGASGFTPVQMLVFAEECVRAGIPRVERGTGERLGGPAILAHGTPQQAFLTSRSDTIWGGTAEIQRNIIAERLLGLPEEPRGRA